MPNPFLQSPYLERLRRDRQEMEQLREESSILSFETLGDPEAPTGYLVAFNGKGLEGSGPHDAAVRESHQVEMLFGEDYPRTLPAIVWRTPILHPNIGIDGRPCLDFFAMGASVRLVDLVEILWDMTRMAAWNTARSDIRSWNDARLALGFPVDERSLRDRMLKKEPEMATLGIAAMPVYKDSEWTKSAIEQYLKSHDLAHDSRVYTREEWAARGEKYGNEALFTITTEGPLYALLNRGDWETAAEELADFNRFLESLGLWYDLGYAWSVHLYPVEQP